LKLEIIDSFNEYLKENFNITLNAFETDHLKENIETNQKDVMNS